MRQQHSCKHVHIYGKSHENISFAKLTLDRQTVKKPTPQHPVNGEVKYLLRSRAGARFPIAFFVELNTHVRQHYYGSCFIILNFDLRFHVAQVFHSEIRCNGSSTVCLLSLAKNRDHLMVLTSSQCQQETGLTHENGWMNKYLTPLSQSAARQSLSNKVLQRIFL